MSIGVFVARRVEPAGACRYVLMLPRRVGADGRPAMRQPGPRREYEARLFFVIMVVLTATAIELVAFAGVSVVSWRIRPRLVWKPDVQFEAGYQAFLAIRHPVLGWPAPNAEDFYSSGAR